MSRMLTLFFSTAELSPVEHALRRRQRVRHALALTDYRTARRQVRAALAELRNGNGPDADPRERAEWYALLAEAWERDPYGSDRHAARYYRRACHADPCQARYWALLARAALRAGAERLARRAMRRAEARGANDLTVVQLLVETLREMGRLQAALRLVLQARFRQPRHPELERLHNYIRFEIVRQAQRQRPGPTATTSPAVLPFMRVLRESGESITVRRDDASSPGPHLARFRRS